MKIDLPNLMTKKEQDKSVSFIMAALVKYIERLRQEFDPFSYSIFLTICADIVYRIWMSDSLDLQKRKSLELTYIFRTYAEDKKKNTNKFINDLILLDGELVSCTP